jgi:CRP-like cAMP-binding protein
MARTDTTVEMLGNVDLFEGLPKKALRQIASAGKELSFDEGVDVCKEGDTDARFYLILDGSARVSIRGREINKLGPGDYFGEISILDGEPRSATVTALSPLRTMSMTSWNFRPIVKENPDIALRIMRNLSRRVREAQGAPTG